MSEFTLKSVHPSKLDGSINFLFENPEKQIIESRIVQRDEQKFIIYLSTQTGCDHACRFCHLTQMGLSTNVTSIDFSDIIRQARTLLDYVENHPDCLMGKPKTVSFNFMARGEPLSSEVFSLLHKRLLSQLFIEGMLNNLRAEVKISSILPTRVGGFYKRIVPYRKILDSMFDHDSLMRVRLYYSLYSVRPEFRKRWLPKAHDPNTAGEILTGLRNQLVIHHALISGENDSHSDAQAIVDWAREYNIVPAFNLVRYNPYSEGQGKESSDEMREAYLNILRGSNQFISIQEVTRVGKDVAASCGMFMNGSDSE